MTRRSVRRGSYRVYFGDGSELWSLSDPGHHLVERADYQVRHGLLEADCDALPLAGVRADMAYLIYDCPTTKLACEKLAAMRAAVRALPGVDDPAADHGARPAAARKEG